MTTLLPGDRVTNINGQWITSQIIERINATDFPLDPIAFFINGGFWRTSRLVKVQPSQGGGSGSMGPTSPFLDSLRGLE